MYHREYSSQMQLEEFALPFGGKPDSNNRWVNLRAFTPWAKIDEYYLYTKIEDLGRIALSVRMAFGAIYIKQSEKLPDEATVTYNRVCNIILAASGLAGHKNAGLFTLLALVVSLFRFSAF